MRVDVNFKANDHRGSLESFLFKHQIVETNLITTKIKDLEFQNRGKHFHKHTNEYLLIISGRMELHVIPLKGKDKNNETILLLTPGEMVLIKPFCYHWSIFYTDTTYMNFLDKKFSQKKPDVHCGTREYRRMSDE